MTTKRKKPTESQVRVLAMQSGQHCAFTGCKQKLFDEASDPRDVATIVAEMAHILAASPGGARHDPSQDPKERASIDNLIVLCDRHHKIVDSQRIYYTEPILREMKATHELAVSRGQMYAMSAVGFAELEVVCSHIKLQPQASLTDLESLVIPPTVIDKMRANSLGEISAGLVRNGLAKTTEVGRFISFSDQSTPHYAEKLRQWFKRSYATGFLDGARGDELFLAVCADAVANAGVMRSEVLEAAAISVVVHLFEICEIFESPDAAA